MKIQKVLKRSMQPPPSLMDVIKQFLVIGEGEIYSLALKTATNWSYGKTDFFHWIGVLNRFDDLFEKLVKKYALPLQQECLSDIDKSTILGIIKITEHLWDNATNRNLYSSYEHLFSLLALVEMDVVHEVMKFLIRPASRLDSQKSLRAPFMNAAPTFQLFADRWAISILDALGPGKEFPNNISMRFYRTAQELQEIRPTEIVQQDQSSLKTPKQEKKKSSKHEQGLNAADSPFSNSASENDLHVSVNIPSLEDKSDSSILSTVVDARKLHHLSGRRSLELLIKIRIGTFMNVCEKRYIMLSIRLLALSILCSAYQEDVAAEKIFMFEPEMIPNLTQALILDAKLPLELRTTILCLIESISRYRTKLTDILGAMNASTNHGHLMILLRKVIAANTGAVVSGTTFSLSTDEITSDFCDVLFSFLTFVLQTQSGGNMLISAGIMPILVSSLNNHAEGQIKVVAKCMSILDDILYAFLPSLDIFRSINGLNSLVVRIGTEIDYCLALGTEFEPDEFLPGIIPDPGVSVKFRKLFARTPLLRALMKLILHMMQSSGTADGMRNLIDSSLPHSILKVFQNSRLFGSVGIFGLAINVMSTFVHNEPTSLAILQEAKLPSAFLKSAKDALPVISALPNAFGAICLNETGMESFIAMNPVDHFLSVFTKDEYLKILLDNDVPHLVGNSIDELIRHHPNLKENLMKSVVKVVKDVLEIGKNVDPAEIEGCTLFVKGKMLISKPVHFIPGTDVKVDQDEDSRLSQFIGIMSAFLEGLFQNSSHCKDFVKYGGLESLLELYKLDGIPADFAVSGSSACMSYIFRSILEVSPALTATAICKEIRSSYRKLEPYFNSPFLLAKLTDLDENAFLTIDSLENSRNEVVEAEKIFRSLVSLKCYIRLLNDIYCSGSLSHSKSLTSVVELFNEKDEPGEMSILQLFSNLERYCTVQKQSLMERFSPNLYKPFDKKEAMPEGYDDLSAKNARLFYPLVDEIPTDFMSLLKGILKIVSNRKVTSSQFGSCQSIIDQIAEILKSNFDISTTQIQEDKLQKIFVALQNTKSLLFEERGATTISMQSFLGYAFFKCGGIATLLSLLKTELVTQSLYSSSSAEEKSSAGLLLSLLLNFVNENLVINSPYTPVLFSRHSRKTGPDYFEPSGFLIDLRLLIFPEILNLFFSENLSKFTLSSVRSIFGIIISVLKAKGEDDQPPHMRSLANRLVSSIFGTMATAQPAPPLQPDDTKVDFLFEMGFPRSAARIALSRCGNSVARATDYILSHPEILSETSPTQNPQTSDNSNPGSIPAASVPPSGLEVQISVGDGAATVLETLGNESSLRETSTSANLDNDVAMTIADSPEAQEIPFAPLQNEDERDPKDELEKLRVSKKQEIVERVIGLTVDMDSALVFNVKELIACVGKKEIDKIAGRLVSLLQVDISAINSAMEPETSVRHRLAILSHLVALVVTDHSLKKAAYSSKELQDLDIVNLLQSVTTNEKWICPMLLILETQFAFSEEPVEEAIYSEPSQFSSGIPVLKFQQPLDNSFYHLTVISMMRLIDVKGLDTDTVHAILRIFVRVTRRYEVASHFVENDGFSALLKLGKLASFPNNEALLIRIARNCFETPEVIQKIFEQELTRFLSIPRPRTVDISSMLKSNSHLVLRAPESFLRAVSAVCKLTNYVSNPVARNCIVALKELAEDVSQPAAIPATFGEMKQCTPQGTPFKSNANDKLIEGSISPVSGKLVQGLSNQLLSLKQQDSVSSESHLRRCFILQTLSELILEYPSCKADLILASQKRKQTPKSTGKNLLISFLLNEVIPIDLLNNRDSSTPIDQDTTRKIVESTWAVCVLVSLCYSSGSKLEELHKSELETIRVIVVEAIIRSLKNNNAENVPFEVQNGKLVSLADLCFKLLSSKTVCYPGQSRASGKIEPHTLSMARIMISKGLVGVLTLSLAELDVHHPSSQKVITSIIAPLDLLSKSAIEIGKIEEQSSEPQSTKKGNSLFDNAFRDLDRPGVEDTPMDISDIYRNSALGIMEPRMDAEGSEFTDSDEYDHSDEMDDTDQESSTDDEMEIVVPQPFMGNEEEEQSEEDDEMMEGEYAVELQIEPEVEDDNSDSSEGFFEQDPGFFDRPGSAVDEGDEGGEEEDEEEDEDPFAESEQSEAEEENADDEEEFAENGLGGLYPGNDGDDPIIEWEADSQDESQDDDEEDGFQDLMNSREDEIANITQLVQQRMGFGTNIRNQGRAVPPTELNIMGRPIFAGRNSQSHANLSHPLLVNPETTRRNGNSTRGIPNISPLADFEIVDRDEIPEPYLDQFLPVTRNPSVDELGQGAAPPSESEIDAQIRTIHSHTLLFSEESLKQLSSILYGAAAVENAVKYGNFVINTLLPSAYTEKLEQKKLDEKRAEEQRLKKEEEERERAKEELEKKKLEEDQSAAPNVATVDGRMSIDNEEPAEVAPESTAPEEQRIVVVVDGNPVDITGKSDFDIGSGIDVTFLEALPDDMRLEVINQHMRERNQSSILSSPPTAGLNAEFLDALPFEIREEVIRQERQENGMREASRRRAAGTNAQSSRTEEKIDPKSTSKSKNLGANRDSVQLVEISGVVSLLRLVFLPESINNSILFALLGNLCENTKSRNEILGLLLSILSAGSEDLASIDEMFSQLTLKSRKKIGIAENLSSSASVPDLVAQRCLEVLIHLARTVSVVGKYFLTESETPVTLKPKSKKGKGKMPHSASVFPVVLLLNLLDQSRFLSNSIVLEQAMRLLSNVLRPLSLIAKKKFTQSDKQGKTEVAEFSTMEASVTEVDRTEGQSSKDEKKEKSDIKLPTIPDSCVINAVTVLKDGISSSKSFQYALSTIQYLCSYPHHLNIITTQLLDSVQALGDVVAMELDLLLSDFKAGTQPLDIGILEPFIIPAASQTKLLRILKTIDYIYCKEGIAQSRTYLSALKDYQEEFKSFEKLESPPSENLVLEKLYEKLRLGKLWQKLGDLMLIVEEKEEFIHVAMTLLPLIEAFMVVSKPSVSIRKKSNGNNAGLPHVLIKQQSDYSEMENDSFLVFAESNKKLLNTMVRNNPSLMNGSFSLLVQNPKILEFDNKRTYFTQQLHKRDSERRTHQNIQINVRRQYVFEESYQQLQGRSGDAIKYGKLNVRFRDEEGVDAGGVTREWFSALALQMFNPDYALFRPSAADKVTYQPNRASGINPDHLFYFKFVGRIIGKAIFDGRLLDAYFTRSFYKCMISAPVDHKDMEAIDPEFYKSLDWILHNDITDVLDLTFSMEVDDFGRQKIIDLKPDGRNIVVNESNKIEYVRLVTEQKLVVAIHEQIEAFLAGFHEIIPRDLVKIFNEQELELLISGMPDIDIDDWKNNTDYQNYSQSSPQIQWFWRAVRSFSQEERAKLIQFATGTSKVPLGGFAQLQGSTGIQKFQIHKEFSSTSRLPSAHTCFNQVDLPQYESYEQLRSCLLLAISESEGFGFA